MQNLRSRRGEDCSFYCVQNVYAAGSILGDSHSLSFNPVLDLSRPPSTLTPIIEINAMPVDIGSTCG